MDQYIVGMNWKHLIKNLINFFGREAGECGWQPIRRYMYGIDRWKPAKNQCFFLNEFFLSTRVGNSLFRSFALCSFTLFTLLKRATGAICSCRSLQKEGVNDSLFTKEGAICSCRSYKRGSDSLFSLLTKKGSDSLLSLFTKRGSEWFDLYKKRERFALVALTKEGEIRSFHSKQKEGSIRSCCSLQKEEAICSCCSLQKRGNHSVLSLFTKRGSD